MWLVSYLSVLEFPTPVTLSVFTYTAGEVCVEWKEGMIAAEVLKEVNSGHSNYSVLVPRDEFPGNVFSDYLLATAYLHIS